MTDQSNKNRQPSVQASPTKGCVVTSKSIAIKVGAMAAMIVCAQCTTNALSAGNVYTYVGPGAVNGQEFTHSAGGTSQASLVTIELCTQIDPSRPISFTQQRSTESATEPGRFDFDCLSAEQFKVDARTKNLPSVESVLTRL